MDVSLFNNRGYDLAATAASSLVPPTAWASQRLAASPSVCLRQTARRGWDGGHDQDLAATAASSFAGAAFGKAAQNCGRNSSHRSRMRRAWGDPVSSAWRVIMSFNGS